MSKIKLCGMFRDEDIDFANIAKPDYIGFIFAKSRRQIDKQTAKKFKEKLSDNIKAVGVFVNSPIKEIKEIVKEGIIDIIQLHGDEDEKYVLDLKSVAKIPIIKAVRVKNDQDIKIADKTNADYLLLDTYSANAMGGTGKTFDWQIIPEIKKPFFLAGGINLDNIEDAIKTDAFCIDTSSGVETNGIKDKDKMIEIVRKVK